MKNKIILIGLFCLLTNLIFAQGVEIINPKNKWYYGAEIGSNTIKSYSFGESSRSFQAGVLAEYYFARHWSLSARIKYYKTGVSFNRADSHSGGWFDLGSDEYFGNFDGAVLTVPVAIKWEFRVYKNLAASIKLGAGYNSEVKSHYGAYSEFDKPTLSRTYVSGNAGYGVNYFLNKNWAVYVDVEGFLGQGKGSYGTILGTMYYNTENVLVNFGVKYSFGKANESNEKPVYLNRVD